ncbi:hypothetical protein A2U01_0098280, partial [Trifolium medium]|nr:hypothetical protein [Trifolium medium]
MDLELCRRLSLDPLPSFIDSHHHCQPRRGGSGAVLTSLDPPSSSITTVGIPQNFSGASLI